MLPRLLVGFPPRRVVAAENCALDHRPGLLRKGEWQRVVELPRQRAAHVTEASDDRRSGRAEGVGVDVGTLADAGHDDPAGARLPVGVEQDRLSELALQLTVVGELPQPADEFRVVRTRGRVVLGEWECERAGRDLGRGGYLDRDLIHRAAMLSERRPDEVVETFRERGKRRVVVGWSSGGPKERRQRLRCRIEEAWALPTPPSVEKKVG